jgi:uncharacterized iron-regulated protein
MIRILALCLSLLFVTDLAAQRHPAYRLYNHKGRPVSYQRMMRDLLKADVVLFGELHNDPIAHWLQQEVTRDIHAARPLVLGAEMFEADNQEALTDYVEGNIDADTLAARARLWSNYDTDYAPLVDFARENGLAFAATNVPRRYASQVYRQGLESLEDLSAEEKAWIAPLPIAYDPELPGYKAMLDMMPGHGGDNFPKAQAIKDATMAHFILENRQGGQRFIHYNGAYHSDNYEGILWYLKQRAPGLNYLTISTVEQADLTNLVKDYKGKADFIIVVDEDMTKTY